MGRAIVKRRTKDTNDMNELMFYRHLDKFIVQILTMYIVAKTFEIYFLAKISPRLVIIVKL